MIRKTALFLLITLSTLPLNSFASPGDSADISIAKTADDTDGVTVGQQVTYLLTVANTGPQASGSITVVDTIAGAGLLTFVGATTSAGSCSATNDVTVTCTLTSLANGASATIHITYRVDSTGLIINSATTSLTDASDPVDTNNTAAYSLVSRNATGGCSLTP